MLDIDLRAIEAIVLSHGHYDHTGGLAAVLTRMHKKQVRIIAHPNLWNLKYGGGPKKGEYRYVGIPFREEELQRLGASFELTTEPTWLTDDVVASGEEPMTTEYEAVAANLCVKQGATYSRDALADDQSVYIRTELGLVIILGCAHRGMVNIVRHAQTLMQTNDVYMILGGTHLGPAPEEQVTRTVEALKAIGVRWLGVSHCTGQKVAAKLSRKLGDSFFFNGTGTMIRFPFKR